MVIEQPPDESDATTGGGRRNTIASRTSGWLVLALLLAVTAATFGAVLQHHFIEGWDDSTAILTNRDYNPPRFSKLGRYWVPPPNDTFYVPVTYTIWGLLAMISRSSAPAGLPFNPAFFYAANLVAHLLSVAIVFVILRRLIPRLWAAAAGAALFALHPIQVEAVCNAWSLYTSLSGFFSFVAIWQYLVFSDLRQRPAMPGRVRFGPLVHYVAATIAFLLALMTKPTAASVPLMIAPIEFFLRKRPPLRWIIPLAPWVAIVPVFIWMNLHAAPGGTVFVPDITYRPLVPLDAIAFYLGKILWPTGLVMDYGRSPLWLMEHPLAWLTAIIGPVLAWLCWRWRRQVPWLAASFGVIVGGLLSTVGIVPFDFQHYSTVADRYAYPAMLGFAMAASFLLCRWTNRLAVGISVALLAVLTALSVRQTETWQDDWHVAAHTLEVNPDSKAGISIFRYLFTRWGHFDPPDHPFPAFKLCSLDERTLMRSADFLRGKRFWDLAAGLYRNAVLKDDRNADAYSGLGAALLQGQEYDQARWASHEALRRDPHNQLARMTLDRLAIVTSPAPSTAPTN